MLVSGSCGGPLGDDPADRLGQVAAVLGVGQLTRGSLLLDGESEWDGPTPFTAGRQRAGPMVNRQPGIAKAVDTLRCTVLTGNRWGRTVAAMTDTATTDPPTAGLEHLRVRLQELAAERKRCRAVIQEVTPRARELAAAAVLAGVPVSEVARLAQADRITIRAWVTEKPHTTSPVTDRDEIRDELAAAGLRRGLAMAEEERLKNQLHQVVREAVAAGMSPGEVHTLTGVDRVTIYKWIGKRPPSRALKDGGRR